MFVQVGGEVRERDPGHGPGPEGLQAPQGGVPTGVHGVRTSGTVRHRCGSGSGFGSETSLKTCI